jgi:homoserine dehydrogenase
MDEDAQLVIVTHKACESALATTIAALRDLDVVHAVSSVIRVEGD